MRRRERNWAGDADAPRIVRAMTFQDQKGSSLFYLDTSPIPEPLSNWLVQSNVTWMDYVLRRLLNEL